MRAILDNVYAVLIARLLLGTVFLFASIEKVADPNAFAVSISYYRLIGEPLTVIVATIVPWMELICGLFLIFGIMPKGSSLLVLFMLLIFTGGIVSGILRGLDISCGCFSQDPNVGKIGWMKVFENVALAVMSLFVLFGRNTRPFLAEERPRSGTP
ncbi:MAG TPA: MauE/DoxX family redox-associated membrane protein [Bacteroidota bacterium]|nr:MauE/DoxX family redox-associated membrane protein [Bacteroidota bacterium]